MESKTPTDYIQITNEISNSYFTGLAVFIASRCGSSSCSSGGEGCDGGFVLVIDEECVALIQMVEDERGRPGCWNGCGVIAGRAHGF